MQECREVLWFLQTSSNKLSLSDSQIVDFTESVSNPQTESRRQTLTTTSNLHRAIFDNISISIINIQIIRFLKNQICGI